MRSILALLLASLMAIPAMSQDKGYSALVAKAKKTIVRDLKDPDSAKFRDIGIYKSTTGKGGVSVCGQINAKNSYGAYNGFRGFMVSDGFALIEGEDRQGLNYEDLAPNLCYQKVESAK